MRFKDRSQLTDLWVELDDPQGNPIRIPEHGSAGSMAQLITLVDIEIKSLNKQGYDYIAPIQAQADYHKMSYRQFISVVIENIICKRQPRPYDACYSDGIGDKLHFLSGKIDKIVDSMPKPMGRVATRLIQAATKATSGKSYTKLSNCEGCGGTRSISSKKSNLGRSGKLNTKLRRNRKK